MDVCLMVEGQEDVTWEDWLALAAVDDRRERGSLDLLHRDLDAVALMGREIAPALAG